jgi:hypothetical protein
LLLCTSFVAGLFLSSFVVKIVFDSLKMEQPELFLIQKLEFKRTRKGGATDPS